MYEAKLTPGDPPSLEHSHGLPRRGFSSNVTPIPRDLIEGREGCRLTVRVPRIYLGDISREEITGRRAIWGTDVYTDDSDIVAACIHGGWIQGAWPEEVDISALDLVVNGGASDTDVPNGKKLNGKPKWEKDIEDIVLEHPPKSGPRVPPMDRDMHVTIVILPALEKYASTVRWGIKSREWKDTHDGLSYMIESVRFVSGVDTAAEIRGKARRVRITAGMKEDEFEREEEAGLLLALANGMGVPHGDVDMIDAGHTNGGIEESFVRGDGSMRGLGINSWWKKQEKKPEPEPAVDEVVPTPSPDAPAPALPEPSPEQQRQQSQPNLSPEQIMREQQCTAEGVNRLYDMQRAAEHIERGHVELQPPEIEPLSSPTLQPVQEPDIAVDEQEAGDNGQQQQEQQHQHGENEVDMTHAWPQLLGPPRAHYQPVQQHYQPSQHQPHHQIFHPHHVDQYQHAKLGPLQAPAPQPQRQLSQVELNEMYEHPAPPPKDGSPLVNQGVEEAAVLEQHVVHEEPLIVRVPEVTPPMAEPVPVPAARAEEMNDVEAKILTEIAPQVVAERQEDVVMGDGAEEKAEDVEQPAAPSGQV